MLAGLPKKARDITDWSWSTFEPYATELESREITQASAAEFLADWTHLVDLISERYSRLYIATTLDTTSEESKKAYTDFLETVFPQALTAGDRIKKKFLASGIEPEGFAIPLRNMRSQADLFREENITLQTEHEKLAMNYYEIIGTQTIDWEGNEITLTQLVPLVKDADRPTRERAWRLASDRVLQDRQAINDNFAKLVNIRRQIAKNADKKDYREYAWQDKLRFDYTPEDSAQFWAAVEQEVVPAAARVYERRRQRYAIESLRPWDVGVDVMRNVEFHGDPQGRAPIKPFDDVKVFEEKAQHIFNRVDPALGEYYAIMRREKTLDLPNYKGKGPGAYCSSFDTEKQPFVFMNAVGSSADVSTLLHEIGHAFHVFESAGLPYYQHREVTAEFAEVASMGMELLGAPYLRKSDGGYFSDDEYARVIVEHLEGILVLWPYICVVDQFNHWANTTPEGDNAAAADAKWGELWDRFIVGPDWSGLQDEKITGWHRKVHIHHLPFYYIEYGMAQLGAVQVWNNALKDQAQAVRDYRKALALGGSVSLPELFRAAGAKFDFSPATFHEAVNLIENTISRLEGEMEAA
jgi:oligoendopeptidase F